MELLQIDAEHLQKAFLAGAKNLETKKEWINELNVFPVPDGDTGTNMTMTIMSAAKEVSKIENVDIQSLCKAIANGSLRGARGNSGVILSQLLRGFTKVIKEADVIDTMTLAMAFDKATQTAYKAVMKPKEGTILTVAKGMSDKALEVAKEVENIVEFLDIVIKEGDEVLAYTPELLPVLKQAGVVDSGGQGLMQILKGAYDGLLGKEINIDFELPKTSKNEDFVVDTDNIDTADIKFGYCTEFIIKHKDTFTSEDEKNFKAYLESIGDSLVCVADEEVVKIHVHTNDPGLAIQKALTYGELSAMKIDNMREEHEERLIKNASKIAKEQKEEAKKEEAKKEIELKDYGFISVSVGEGLKEIFTEIGVDYVISGGQTMNPSTEDILNAIDKVHAKTIYVLPNNKNIILAANQASSLTKDKEVVVVPTKTIPQGIGAIIAFLPELTAKENLENMLEQMDMINSASVTYAVRDTNIDGYDITQDDIMGIGDSGMLSVGKDINDTTVAMIDKLVDEDSELLTIYYGEDIDEDIANALTNILIEKYPNLEIELQYGGQPVYYYFVSVE